jgi:hypothetical protein
VAQILFVAARRSELFIEHGPLVISHQTGAEGRKSAFESPNLPAACEAGEREHYHGQAWEALHFGAVTTP